MSGPAAAEIYLRLIAEAELRERPLLSGPGPHLHRVWLAAATLAAVGAVGPDVAWQVASEFEASAGLRSGNIGPLISSLRRPSWTRTGAGPAGQARGMIKMYLTPPLHPAATALDVIVTGPDRQIRATVPLGRAADGPRPGWPPQAPIPPGLPPAPDPGQ